MFSAHSSCKAVWFICSSGGTFHWAALLCLIAKSLWSSVGLKDSWIKMGGRNWAPVDVRRRAALHWKFRRRGLPTVSTAHGEDEACRAILSWVASLRYMEWAAATLNDGDTMHPCSAASWMGPLQSKTPKWTLLLKLDEYLADEDAIGMQKQLHSYTHVLLSKPCWKELIVGAQGTDLLISSIKMSRSVLSLLVRIFEKLFYCF